MTLYERVAARETKISIIGLGYVGMPMAVAFAKKADVIGFDTNPKKIETYQKGIDPTKEVGDEAIRKTTVLFTSDETRLKEAQFHIVSVPTPINPDKTPDLSPVENASRVVGRNLTVGSVVVFESTVYPGVTEDVCVPILERESGLKCGTDFKIGYSPERINPGDKLHRLENIVKIVSGMDDESLDDIARVYELVIEAGIHRAPSIKVAEAAKVVENSQRDLNIAFMNELAMVFDRMGINSTDVVEAMNTKWNALKFYPGLVGGHCIGVDPYYFIYQAEKLGYHSQIILAGRKINDSMSVFIADAIIKKLILAKKVVSDAKVVILGMTFKENCPDIRNSKVVDVIARLREYGIRPVVVDPHAVPGEVEHEYGIRLTELGGVRDADCVVFAVAHDVFKALTYDDIAGLFAGMDNDRKIIIDVKSIVDKRFDREGYSCWRL